jgi:FMN-dependent NADH-azoreductase
LHQPANRSATFPGQQAGRFRFPNLVQCIQERDMKLLHIVATPRDQKSNTLRVANAFIQALTAKHPDLSVEVIDLFNQDLPAVAGANIDTKYSLTLGQPIDKHHQESWRQIELEIQRFMGADLVVISAPMWNFSIPYALKYYIDALVQPGYLYKYNEMGRPVPLVHGKKMVCITSRGGDYSPQSPLHVYDFQEPYLRTIFGFVGIVDLHFVNAEPMDITLDLREAAINAAVAKVLALASDHHWDGAGSAAGVESPPQLKPASIRTAAAA